MLVLSVQFHERRHLIFQRRGGHERVVHKRAAAALRCNFTADDQFGIAALEDRLYRGLGFARADEIGRCATADEEAIASTSMDLPAPVSPVRTLRPGSNSTWTASMTARCSTRRKRSICGRELQCYHMFDSCPGAC